jgi:hypothetical protein
VHVERVPGGWPSIRRGIGRRHRGHVDGMDIDTARERNQEKAEQESERGPARSEPDAAPIADAIEAFHARGARPSRSCPGWT